MKTPLSYQTLPWRPDLEEELQLVYENGSLLREQTLGEIRQRVWSNRQCGDFKTRHTQGNALLKNR